MTQKFDPADGPEAQHNADLDLARRLARYRRRIEAEDRPRSLKMIDRAIRDAGGKGDRT